VSHALKFYVLNPFRDSHVNATMVFAQQQQQQQSNLKTPNALHGQEMIILV